MKRRRFLGLSAAAALGERRAEAAMALAGRDAAPPQRATLQGRMKAGTQHGDSDDILRTLAALGVNHICSSLPSRKLDEAWSVEGLSRLRERVESFGIRLEMAPLPLSSVYITKAEYPHIMLGKSPERDREIDEICQMIRNAARAGIPALKYNLTILGVVRTAPTRGRGGALYSTFVYEQARQDPPLTEAGPVSADEMWERITYFLKRVIPVAEEYKVRMACHPHDPGVPPEGYQGVQRVLGTVEGLKKFITIQESPYHGLNFCQGTVAEMLQDPGREIFDVIRYFGERGKIFNVHLRNIRGRRDDFQEVYPDEGDVDMVRAAILYRDLGYQYMLMPDHVPRHPDDPGGSQAFAFAYGHIRGIIQALAYIP